MTEIKHVTVKEIMSTDMVMIDGLVTIEDTLNMMRTDDIGALVINRRDNSDEYGLLTVEDIARTVVVPDKSPSRTSAYEVMQKPVLSLRANMNIRYAIRLMTNLDISRALVVEEDAAIGIISLRDMVLRYTEA